MPEKYGNPRIRVWNEVHSIYKSTAKEYNLVIGDLTSTILLEVAINGVPLVVYALQRWFRMRYHEAIDIALKLRERALNMIENALKVEEVEGHAQD